MGMMRHRRAVVAAFAALVAAGLSGGAGHARANPAQGYFKTPSGNIICNYAVGAFVDCGIRSGLKPTKRPRHCRVGDPIYNRIDLPASGRPDVPRCAGDPGPFLGLQHHPRTLAYGKHWSGAGTRCTSRTRGLTCRNRSGHGFFLSRAHWHLF
jgi:hypothetical protein